MRYLVKKEVYLHTPSLLFFLFFVPIGYVLNMPMLTIYLTVFILLLANAFYYDYKNNVHALLKSLPVIPQHTVLAKYIVLFVLLILFLLYQWMIDALAHLGLPYLKEQPINRIHFLFTLLGFSMLLSIVLPVFYHFRSFVTAVVVMMGLIFIVAFGFAITAGNEAFPYTDYFLLSIFYLIDIQPFLISSLLTMLCLFISYRISTAIFKRKDCF
ncbi:ABC-2 transporter permease [Virgibacillus sp. W0430]|uniref:ABC-2 transporter permease n=1 Tax=Virgibacillus sp. W0430 TaxID=3391580 RepID=UPI003F4586FA